MCIRDRQVVEKFFLGGSDHVRRNDVRCIGACGREVDLPIVFDGFIDQFKILFEDDGLPFVLRKKGIGGKHIAEVIGQCRVSQKTVLDITDII